MESSLIGQEVFLLYMALFIVFFICCMLLLAGTQLYAHIRKIEQERNELLGLLGRQLPYNEELPETATVLSEFMQDNLEKIKEGVIRLSNKVEQRERNRQRLIIFDKVDFDTK